MSIGPVFFSAGENLVPVSTCYNIISLFIFLGEEGSELFGLLYLAVVYIVALQVKIHQHQFLLGVRDGHPGHQKAALEVRNGNRPGKWTGQADPRRLRNSVPGSSQQTAVHLSDGRPGIGHKLAGDIQRKGAGKAFFFPERFRFIQMETPLGVGVYLLKQNKIRLPGSQASLNSRQVLVNPVLRFRLNLPATVHKEITLLPQGAVADVPGKDCKGRPIQRRRSADYLHLLHRFRTELGDHKHQEQAGRGQQNNPQEYPQDQETALDNFHNFRLLFLFTSAGKAASERNDKAAGTHPRWKHPLM